MGIVIAAHGNEGRLTEAKLAMSRLRRRLRRRRMLQQQMIEVIWQ